MKRLIKGNTPFNFQTSNIHCINIVSKIFLSWCQRKQVVWAVKYKGLKVTHRQMRTKRVALVQS